MKKNPFKKQSIIDTLTATAIGGAGNVAFDYAWDALGMNTMLASESGTNDNSRMIKNAIKLVGGALAGSMVKNKYVRSMTDGFAVVGASNLVSDLLMGSESEEKTDGETDKGSNGLPSGTIGRLSGRRYGIPRYAMNSKRSGRGVNGLDGFME